MKIYGTYSKQNTKNKNILWTNFFWFNISLVYLHNTFLCSYKLISFELWNLSLATSSWSVNDKLRRRDVLTNMRKEEAYSSYCSSWDHRAQRNEYVVRNMSVNTHHYYCLNDKSVIKRKSVKLQNTFLKF